MKAVLIFPPFNLDLPSYIPFGISSLKSYVELNSEHEIKCFDFNQEFFFNALSDTKVLDICIYCKRTKAGCAQSKQKNKFDEEMQFKKSSLYLLTLLKDPTLDYRLKCKIRHSISKFYKNFVDCWIWIISSRISSNSNKDLDRIFRYYMEKVIFEQPDIIGFSLFSYSQLAFSLYLAKLLKNSSNRTIIFGGHIISIMSQEKRSMLLNNYNFIDYLIEKEGELALLGLLNQKPRERVPNLIYLEKNTIKTNRLMAVNDINKLPAPDYSDFDIDKYILPSRVLLLSTSKNCPWNKCIFCSSPLSFNKGFRQKKPALVIKDVKMLINKYRTNIFFFIDPCLTVGYLERLLREVRKSGLKINYGLCLRFEKKLKDKKFMKALYESGCRYIQLGVETLVSRVSKIINKGIDVNNFEETLINCKRNNIYCHITAIFGLPFQYKKDIEKEIREYRRLSNKTDFTFEINMLSVICGTTIHKSFKKYAMRIKKQRLANLNGNPLSQLLREPRYESACINSRSLRRLFLKANKEINKDRTFRDVCRDDIFLADINSYRTKAAS
ncbi:MAG: radical SAM protein [Candidatus Omnitrophota bacterium]